MKATIRMTVHSIRFSEEGTTIELAHPQPDPSYDTGTWTDAEWEAWEKANRPACFLNADGYVVDTLSVSFDPGVPAPCSFGEVVNVTIERVTS